MSLSRIAKRYAKPLLELAEERKLMEEVRKDMENFTAICEENRSFVNMLNSPIITHLRKAEILNTIFKGKVNDLTLSVFSIITRKNREMVLPYVSKEFISLYNEKMGIQEATITTTFPLDSKMRSQVVDMVEKVTGKKSVLEEKVDPEIIGGYLLELGDTQIDESISSQLKELKIKFKKENN